MRYRLRTLLILLAIGPPIVAPLSIWCWHEFTAWRNGRLMQFHGTGYLGAIIEDDSGLGSGVLVVGIRPGSPAEAAGLKTNDVISLVNRRRCRDLNDFDSMLMRFSPGDSVPVVVARDGKQHTLAIQLGKRPASGVVPVTTPPVLGNPGSLTDLETALKNN